MANMQQKLLLIVSILIAIIAGSYIFKNILAPEPDVVIKVIKSDKGGYYPKHWSENIYPNHKPLIDQTEAQMNGWFENQYYAHKDKNWEKQYI